MTPNDIDLLKQVLVSVKAMEADIAAIIDDHRKMNNHNPLTINVENLLYNSRPEADLYDLYTEFANFCVPNGERNPTWHGHYEAFAYLTGNKFDIEKHDLVPTLALAEFLSIEFGPKGQPNDWIVVIREAKQFLMNEGAN